MNSESATNDAFPPKQIARRVESLGVVKARTDTLTLFVLATLAGAFISIGALFFIVVVTGSGFGFGPTRLLGGLSFSLGLILVVVAGAELFTGNNLIAMAWASRRIGFREVCRNWLIAYTGNMLGCLATAALVLLARSQALGGGAVGETAMAIAVGKCALGPGEAFARGLLCNALVCLAVWLTLGGRSVTDKVLAIIFPITGFVVMGFEHSIANWFFFALGFGLDIQGTLSVPDMARNLAVVTAGNVVGGTLLVSGVYWLAYLRPERQNGTNPQD